MSDTNPNTPTVEELTAQVAALREFRAGIAKGFGLGDDADDTAILSAVGTAAKERDDSRAEVVKMKGERNAEKIDTALRDAFEKSGAGRENAEDFFMLARPLFTVDEKGRVVTRSDAENTPPGIDPAAWVVAELQAKRSHWFPPSVGGGARGGGIPPNRVDDSMFDPRSANYNYTAQLAAEAKYGPEFADKARARYRGRGGAW